ncbi:MAG: hypothetical protein RLZZ301_710 [Bacteroidota bacterium]|jgi:uncharacterized NAD(P)/FAD-binding protein YdhS
MIGIIGNGAASLFVLQALLDHAYKGQVLHFGTDTTCVGPAYSQTNPALLLNVAQHQLGLQHPSDFSNWLIEQHPQQTSQVFVPRALYGNYLRAQKERLLEELQGSGISYTYVQERPTFELQEQQLLAIGKSGKWPIDQLILATGNAAPAFPNGTVTSADPRILSNPWSPTTLLLKNDDCLFLLGNGLSMVDQVILWRSKGFQGKIVSLSRHGYGIMAHENQFQPTEVPNNKSLHALLSFFNQLRKTKPLHLQAAVQALRPELESVYSAWSDAEKARFFNRLRHAWGSIRHRLPPAQAQFIADEIKAGTLQVCAGELLSIHPQTNALQLRFRSSGNVQLLNAALLVNCTGPQLNPSLQNNPSLDSLLQLQAISVDALQQGLRLYPATYECQCPYQTRIFALGNLCRGERWESTAIPEIRKQARLIATQLCKEAKVSE